jgi:hypothetical protein
MPFSQIAEKRIREAIAQGDFENLPGSGQPLERAVAQAGDATARESLQRALTNRRTQLAIVFEHRSRRER